MLAVILPAVLPAVFYQDVRRWQRRGAKLLAQRSLILSLVNRFLSALPILRGQQKTGDSSGMAMKA